MKYIVAGGRDFDDYDRLHAAINQLTGVGDTIISGCASGADSLGEKYAKSQPEVLKLERMPADWDKYKKAAGYIRNHQMALAADGLIAFWDGKSKGTKNMIEEAHKARLETHVYYY